MLKVFTLRMKRVSPAEVKTPEKIQLTPSKTKNSHTKKRDSFMDPIYSEMIVASRTKKVASVSENRTRGINAITAVSA